MSRRITKIRLDSDGIPHVALSLRDGVSVSLNFHQPIRIDYLVAIARQQCATGSALNQADIQEILKRLADRYRKRKNPPSRSAGVISKFNSFIKIWRYDLRLSSDRQPYSEIVAPKGGEFEKESAVKALLRELYGFDADSQTYYLASPDCPIEFASPDLEESDAAVGSRYSERDSHDDSPLDSEVTAYLMSLKSRVSAPHMFMDSYHQDWRGSDLNLNRTCLSFDAKKKLESYGGRTEQPDVLTTEQRILVDEFTNENFQGKVRIEGDAGVGKSTLLEEICWTVACDPESRRVPLLARLDQWPDFIDASRDRKDRTLLSFLAFSNTSLDMSFLRGLCLGNRALILLDGLDEIQNDDSRAAIAHWLDENANSPPFQQCPVLLTGRSWAFTQSDLRTFGQRVVTIEPLNRQDIEQYIGAYFMESPALGKGLSNYVTKTPQVYRLITSPLFLAMLCFVWRHDQSKGPVSATRIFGRAIRHLLERRIPQIRQELKGDDQLGTSTCLRLLSLLAWTSWSQSTGTHLHGDDALEALGDAFENDRILSREIRATAPSLVLGALVRHAGIIDTEDDLRYRFTNHRVMEYLAGRHLAALESTKLVDVFARNAWNPRWQDVLVHVAAELANASPARQKLGRSMIWWLILESQDSRDDVWRNLVLLAARMAGSGSDLLPVEKENRTVFFYAVFRGWQDAVNGGCVEQEKSACEAYGLLASTLPDECLGDLLGLFERSDEWIQHQFFANSRYGVAAVKTLALTGGDEVVDLLISTIGTSYGPACEVSGAAIDALGELAVTHALSHIIDDAFKRVVNFGSPASVFNNRSRYNRYIDALRRIDAAAAANSVRIHLESHDPQKRSLACIFLGEFQDEGSIDQLMKLVASETEITAREWAIDALGRVGANEVVDMLTSLLPEEQEYSTYMVMLYALACVGTRQAAEAIAEHYLKRPDRPATGGQGIGSIDLWSTVPLTLAKRILVDRLSDPDENVKAHAMSDLASLHCHEFVPFLLEIVAAGASVLVKMGAVGSLGLIGASESMDCLTAIATDVDESMVVRFTSVQSLTWIENRHPETRTRTVDTMIALLDDNEVALRREAAESLGSLVDPRSVPFLVAAADDSDKGVRLASISALGEIRAKDAAPMLQGFLKHTDGDIRFEALKSLAMIGSDLAIEFCRQALQGETTEVLCEVLRAMGSSPASSAAEYCAELVSHAEPSVREQATRTLGEIGGPEAIDGLKPALADDDIDVQNAAAAELRKVHSQRAVEILWSAGRTRDASMLCRTLGCTILLDGSIGERASLALNPGNRPDAT